jgi:hypothetical protein
MPVARMSYERCKEAVDAATRALAQGGSIRQGAALINLTENQLQGRLRAARQYYGLTPTAPEPPTIEFDTTPPAKQRIRVKAPTSRDDSPIYRVLGIGDAHDSPELPKDRFGWLGKYAADIKPDAVVFIGDIADFDSLSKHALPGSMSDKLRPSYARDLESLEEALSLYRKHSAGITTHVTLGNHEGRIWRYEEASASAAGMLTGPFLDVMARFDLRTHKEGEWLMIGGVGWVHAPRTLMNREYGGKWLNSIANDSRVSTVCGHSHRGQVVHAPKIGPFGGITIVNLGSAMPMGYIKPYARVATTSWTWGAYVLTIQAGHIIGHDFISMQALAERYA